jgi:ssDNA-binding Zn-finger/Zn-ribbon topoisomerase 1
MILRHNQETREEFWGCEKFPSCRGTRPLHGEQPTKPGEQPTKPANSSLVAAIPPARISPVDGLKHVEEYCKVEMAVSVAETGKSGVIFLNSEPQYRSPKNFGIMLSVTALGELKMVQIDPLTFFKGRTIRVTGVVREYLGHAEIIVDHKGQIEWDGMPGK